MGFTVFDGRRDSAVRRTPASRFRSAVTGGRYDRSTCLAVRYALGNGVYGTANEGRTGANSAAAVAADARTDRRDSGCCSHSGDAPGFAARWCSAAGCPRRRAAQKSAKATVALGRAHGMVPGQRSESRPSRNRYESHQLLPEATGTFDFEHGDRRDVMDSCVAGLAMECFGRQRHGGRCPCGSIETQ